jgi:hypothetical protein
MCASSPLDLSSPPRRRPALQLQADGSSSKVALRSPYVNLTLEARSEAALALPITCDSPTGAPVTATLPAGVLGMIFGADPSEAVRLVLSVTSVNLHGLGVSSANLSSAGPTVKFELRQRSGPLAVHGLTTPMNLSMPLASTTNTSALCVGTPDEAAVLSAYERLLAERNGASAAALGDALREAGCAEAMACGWWDESSGAARWSTAGCAAVADGAGDVVCSCDHLTDFMVVQVPHAREEPPPVSFDLLRPPKTSPNHSPILFSLIHLVCSHLCRCPALGTSWRSTSCLALSSTPSRGSRPSSASPIPSGRTST